MKPSFCPQGSIFVEDKELRMLPIVAWASLAVAFFCAMLIVVDELRRPQKMMVMNIVWPITALYGSVFALWAYFRVAAHAGHAREEGAPTWGDAALSDTHCGAGCMLGDIVAEFAVFAFGLTLFGMALYASFAVDLAAAWLVGIVFQYFSIKPMSHLSSGQALAAAIKVDTLSILAFQVGMYLWMALTRLVLFPKPQLLPDEAVFWFMMQIAMICGFLTALPMNLWLLRKGVKHSMHGM
jgi:hypothetical protein